MSFIGGLLLARLLHDFDKQFSRLYGVTHFPQECNARPDVMGIQVALFEPSSRDQTPSKA